ncbi:hypothetical protein SLW70_11790 [Flavobacterium sp. NG2]|uniref:hypothetical protein n=1 Tax=Flavobacterium sp. NG2 TaxID=3097547 RepID=UPI002A814C55|nr:hypothetical protein [Flavobacterium sp. NG2]WPR70614.1 hypothetical protein SLW70_11790 [Flavobacterium sp. NG2]
MNLEARKIEFVQEFLKLQSEEVISRLEKILKKECNFSEVKKFEPMTQEELDKRIDQSEADFLNKRYKSSSELLAKYE